MQQPRTSATVLAFIFLTLMLAALGFRFWVGAKAYDFTGPTHIAAAGDDVYLHAAGDLYHLKRTGELVRVMPPDFTGLDDIPIDLRVLDDGTLLIAEQAPESIRLCLVEPWQCRLLDVKIASQVRRQYKVVYFPAGNELFLTDAEGDTLWRAVDRNTLLKLVPDQTLAGPNDLAFDTSGNLWVADTDHRRIVELVKQVDGTFLPGREHSAQNAFTVGKRHFPMMLARAPDDRWWVIQATDFSEALADIVVYDAAQGAQAVIDLPAAAYPTDIVPLGGIMLVTDLERYMVYKIDSNTLAVSEFGDDPFRQRMRVIREKGEFNRLLSTGSLVGMIIFAVLMLLAAIRATPENRRWTVLPGALDIENAPERVPATHGIHWLERDPGWDRAQKWIEPMSYILLITGIVGAFVLYGWARFQAGSGADEELVSKVNELGVILVLCVTAMAFIIPVIHFRLRCLKQQIGTDGKRLLIRLTDGRELSVEPDNLYYTNLAIHYRQYTFPLRGAKQKPIYLAGEVETWLAPLLRQASRLTAVEAIKYRWKHRDDSLLWPVAAFIVMALVLISLAAIAP